MYIYIKDLLPEIISKLRTANIETPRLDSRIIIAHVLGIDENDVLFYKEQISPLQYHQILDLINQRILHKPVCKIIGKKYFYKHAFVVNEDVLSPRPDTEVLVEAAIEYAKKIDSPKIVDLGTGSGCILLSIIDDVKDSIGCGVDVSEKALSVAKINRNNLKLDDRIDFVQASWFDEGFENIFANKFDLIVSNPPYIPKDDIDALEEDVKNYDPIIALSDGDDGYKHYRQIALISKNILKKDGQIFLEVGIYQDKIVKEIFEKQGFEHISTIKDLGGIDRCVILKK